MVAGGRVVGGGNITSENPFRGWARSTSWGVKTGSSGLDARVVVIDETREVHAIGSSGLVAHRLEQIV